MVHYRWLWYCLHGTDRRTVFLRHGGVDVLDRRAFRFGSGHGKLLGTDTNTNSCLCHRTNIWSPELCGQYCRYRGPDPHWLAQAENGQLRSTDAGMLCISGDRRTLVSDHGEGTVRACGGGVKIRLDGPQKLGGAVWIAAVGEHKPM